MGWLERRVFKAKGDKVLLVYVRVGYYVKV